MRVINVHIEPLEERYSAQWYVWLTTAFSKLNIQQEWIGAGRLRDHIQDGLVLDAYDTNYWKAGQLQELMKLLSQGKIGDDDIVFFHDLWFPGLEMLQYVRNMTGIRFKIYGLLHAGTWDKHDFTYKRGMRKWGAHVEAAWLEIADKVFVAYHFHKGLILNDLPWLSEKIHVRTAFSLKHERSCGT